MGLQYQPQSFRNLKKLPLPECKYPVSQSVSLSLCIDTLQLLSESRYCLTVQAVSDAVALNPPSVFVHHTIPYMTLKRADISNFATHKQTTGNESVTRADADAVEEYRSSSRARRYR